jgi:chorismate-pyruvate lyase
VQFGIVRIDLTDLNAELRSEIVGRRVPLGRALIRHNVLRQVELQHLWRVQPAPLLRDQLQLGAATPLFGRTARIVVDGQPTVELLEIPRA